MSDNIVTNVGLYSANVVIEYNVDQKVVKPVIKVNSLATTEEITQAAKNAIYALNQATFELANRDYAIPDPLKEYIATSMKQIEEQKELEKQYADNDEILNVKDGGVESHSQ